MSVTNCPGIEYSGNAMHWGGREREREEEEEAWEG
jgi:hypothetical protein